LNAVRPELKFSGKKLGNYSSNLGAGHKRSKSQTEKSARGDLCGTFSNRKYFFN